MDVAESDEDTPEGGAADMDDDLNHCNSGGEDGFASDGTPDEEEDDSARHMEPAHNVPAAGCDQAGPCASSRAADRAKGSRKRSVPDKAKAARL